MLNVILLDTLSFFLLYTFYLECRTDQQYVESTCKRSEQKLNLSFSAKEKCNAKGEVKPLHLPKIACLNKAEYRTNNITLAKSL